MKTERALVDTNVLVYAMFPQDPRHKVCRELLETADHDDAALCVAERVLVEFFRVVTDPRKVQEARSPNDALAALGALLSRPGLEVLPTPGDLVSRWMDLVRRRPVVGRRVFDVVLVATMLGNGVRRIYTYNHNDFTPFDELEVLDPAAD